MMDSPKPIDATKAAPVEIDYDHVNVAEIMARIQKSAAEARPAEVLEEKVPREAVPASFSPASTSPASPPPAPPAPPQTDGNLEPQGAKQKIKKIVRKLMRPFFPVIRLLAFPIHEELRATIKSLHETNVRLDNLDRLLQLQAEKYDQSLQRLEVRFDLSLQMLETKFEQKFDFAGERTDRTELRLDLLEERLKDLDKSMGYIRLLHNLGHNLVVELTKLKVEADTLKSKFRILEKDQEFAQKRERALEEQALK
ncbi:MAG: hypothetical protein Q8O91_08805 [Candidatus Aminicenantes bacterium]|nr:hypothetical protein [Candidatus Aminicenantes bacterium]